MALTQDEDGELKRLAVFHQFGLLMGEVADRFEDLRQRDRRNQVREPTDIVSANPVRLTVHNKREWGE